MVVRDNSDLPRKKNRAASAPLLGDTLMRRIAAKWWEMYRLGPDYTRDRAMPELPLRASAISMRCDRALWYSLVGMEQTDPPDAASTFRMHMGQIVHELITDAMKLLPDWQGIDDEGRRHGWYAEDVIDLRPAGFPGSAHGDLVYYRHGAADVVAEAKTEGGFGFKVLTTNFKGDPEGPRWAHTMQAAMAAVALGASKVINLYVAMEPISPDLAAKMDADEFGRFTAQWVFDLDDESPVAGVTWREAVAREAKRQVRILALADYTTDGQPTPYRPERQLSLHDVPGGAIVFDPAKGKWSITNLESGMVMVTGSTWMCGYCNWQQQCISDGPEATIVTLTPRKEDTDAADG